jgi:hypothetical protein
LAKTAAAELRRRTIDPPSEEKIKNLTVINRDYDAATDRLFTVKPGEAAALTAFLCDLCG